ncbi:chorismate-binding protein [Vibrio sp. 10N.286.49.B3]|uniref:chromate efflux transporter n=1 Tax=Vibrio sp. 10N.286.49.B3 TaxID=1880855 RepID=UPI000C856A56|nr:chromate efflux transporter [Vibrio sp. 10N.286.49.B3]PMH41169.1 chorismate-binding protein [Vibrio sp. 10N.286.49.B3]
MFSIFKTFLLLGFVSFGGPAAHLGYFRQSFVEKYKWLSDEEYAQIVALSQFLPGPGSSQVGFAIGYKKGGCLGGVMAFLGFTLPSVLLMVMLAILSHQFIDSTLFTSIIHGLKLLAVVVVVDACWGMYKNFCQDKITIGLCALTAIALLIIPSVTSQIAVLIFAAIIGYYFLNTPSDQQAQRLDNQNIASKNIVSWPPLIIFLIGLLALPLLSSQHTFINLFSHFFQAGSFVFGGGHVVLPLLQNNIGTQLSPDSFLAGYAFAQAVPGPMFTLATYIGYELLPNSPITGALIATIAIFTPGFLLMLAVLKNWQKIAAIPAISASLRGVNAAVVGLLLAALYSPIYSHAVVSASDMALVICGFYLLKQIKLPIVYLVLFFALSAVIIDVSLLKII